MSAAHHARDDRKAGGEDPLHEQWRHFEVMRANTVTVSAVETPDQERRVIVIVDGAADLRFPFGLSPKGAKKLAADLLQVAEQADSGHIPKPPRPSSHH